MEELITQADNLFRKGEKLFKEEYYLEGINFLKKASLVYKDKQKWDKYAVAYNIIGEAFRKLHMFDDALKYLEDALKIGINQLGTKSLITATSYDFLGLVYHHKQDSLVGIAYIEKAIDIKKDLVGSESNEVANSYLKLSFIFLNKKEYDLGLDFSFKGIKIKNALNVKDKELAMLYNNIGNVLNVKGYHRKAMKYLNLSISLKIELGINGSALAASYFSIANSYRYVGDYNKSIIYLEKTLAIDLRIFGEDTLHIAATYYSLSSNYSRLNEYNQAIKYIDLSLFIFEKEENVYNIFLCIVEKGGIFYEKNEYDEALFWLKKGLKMAIEIFGENSSNVADIYVSIANCQNSFYKTIEYNKKALSIYKTLSFPKIDVLSGIYYNIGLNQYKIEDYENSLKNIQNALIVISENFNSKNILTNPSIFNYYDSFRLSEALNIKGKVLYHSFQENMCDIKYLMTSFETYNLSINHFNNVRKNCSLESSKFLWGEKHSFIYEEAIEVALELYKQTKTDLYRHEIFKYSEKYRAMVLYSKLRHLDAQLKHIPLNLAQKEHDLQVELSYLRKQKKQNPNNIEIKSKYFDFYNEWEELIKKLEKNYPKYFALKYEDKVVEVVDIQKHLTANQALIQFFVGEKNLFIFAITQQTFEVKKVQKDVSFKEYVDDVKDFFSSRNVNDENRNKIEVESTYIKSAYKLYKLLFGQIKHLLQNINDLIIISDGELSSIPFEALIEPTNERDLKKVTYLIQKYSISHHYSATLWLYNQNKLIPDKIASELKAFFGVAPITFGKSEIKECEIKYEDGKETKRSNVTRKEVLDSLFATKEEVGSVYELFKEKEKNAKVLMYRSASKEEFVKNVNRYKVILISTHGHKAANSKLSGIVFSKTPSKQSEVFKKSDETMRGNNDVSTKQEDDNILTIDEVYTLRLNADLVVLSSCSSGIGELVKGEGMIAMNRAFLYAGAKNILYTVYDIVDEPSKELVCSFFTAYLKEDMSYSKALQRAKMKAIVQGIDPYYWASFVLIGNN